MDFSFIKRHLTSTFEAPDVDLSGKTVLVTGATAGGLGYEAALHFARRNCKTLILAMRNEERGQTAINKIRSTLPDYKGDIQFWKLDMGNFESIRKFSDRVETLEELHIFLANAGVAHFAWKMGDEGYENTLQINVIATGLIALRALPVLARTADTPGNTFSTLTIVASEVHEWAKLAQQNEPNIIAALNSKEKATPQDTYNISKLLDVFMARELAKLPQFVNKVVINSVNPGLCKSELRGDLPRPIAALFNYIAWSTEYGSRSFVFAATQQTSAGAYISDAKETPPSAFVTSEKGQKVQKQIWSELKDIWVKVDPKVQEVLA